MISICTAQKPEVQEKIWTPFWLQQQKFRNHCFVLIESLSKSRKFAQKGCPIKMKFKIQAFDKTLLWNKIQIKSQSVDLDFVLSKIQISEGEKDQNQKSNFCSKIWWEQGLHQNISHWIHRNSLMNLKFCSLWCLSKK